MKNTVEKSSKSHKYNVGDEFVIKVVAVREQDGQAVYDIEGIDNMSFTEKTLEKFSQREKPGDIVYIVSEGENDIYLDATYIEDISGKEVKIYGEWIPINDGVYFDEESAEQRAQELAEKTGYVIKKVDLFE